MSKALTKLKEIIGLKLSKEEIAELEALTKVTVKMKDVKTKDGLKTLSFEGEMPMKDAPISDITSGTPVPFEGEAELEDGTKIKAVAGVITEVMEVEVQETPEQLAAKKALESVAPQVAQMSVQMKADKENFDKQVSELKKENVELKKQIQLTAKAIDVILNTEIKNASEKEKIEKEYDAMTNAEKVKFNRGEKIYV
jgi:hypothetical protein